MLLDPCFKFLSIALLNKHDNVINKLQRKINFFLQELQDLIIDNPIKTSNMFLFFEEEAESTFLSLDIELQIYLSILQMPKYELTDPLYKNNNSLI
ncbi:9700_t:CDS:1, partial [Cetraspora pellucida]